MSRPPTPPFLTIWVVYFDRPDHPGKYVLAAQDVVAGNPEPVLRPLRAVCDTLEAARAALPEFQRYEHNGRTWGATLVLMARHPDDHPTIVETWI